MIKRRTKGNEGWITSYAFWLFGKKCIVSLSETKWHDGEKHKKTPIWVSNIRGRIPTLFIWKLAIGYEKKKK